MKTETSPRPWALNTASYSGWTDKGGLLGEIEDANGKAVYSGPASFHSLRKKANAELIVRAVNSYDALVEALEKCLMELKAGAAHDAVDVAETALRLAKEGK